MKIKPPYKAPLGQWLTESLFYERVRDMGLEFRPDFDPPFSLSIERAGCVNFRTTFVALMDPTGYKWAMRYLGDYEHWNRLIRCTWFQAAYQKAMDEMKTKIRSEALGVIQDIARGGQPAQSLVAAKYLAGFEWEKGGRGRPSKGEVTGELKRQAQLLAEEDDDAARIGLNLKVVK